MNKQPLHILLALVALLLASCSTERHNPLSKTYHNTTARYNGYFLAKEKMRAVQESLQEQMAYDYSQVLPLYPTLDSTTAKAATADLEDVIKKASFPIQWHKNSKWIDDCYLLIGQAQFYQLNFAEAAKTFKFVNSTSKDKSARHEALVWLMRSFMKLEMMDDAQAVSEFLRKERLNKDNARELYLARAQYNRLQGDTAAVIENLALSLPNFDERDDLSRARFTLAQLYQRTGQNKEAFKQYSKVLRNNPPYDLGFFSRLNLGQVTELGDTQDLERIAGYYQKLLKDDKNKEYRDKIYYEMAQFELRQQHYDKALDYLEQSLRTPGALPNQKAYSYVLAGEIYFDDLNKYNLAEAYYDSAVQVYPPNALNYEAVAERRNVLADFVKQYNTIQTQDSLQRLAHMSETDRTAFLQQLVQHQEEERQQELARQQEQEKIAAAQPRRSNSRNNKNGSAFPTDNGSSANGVWYFDNPAAMASARSEFTRRWGNRPLQDFWRIRSRGEAEEQAPQPVAEATEAPAAPAENEQTPEERTAAQLQGYLQNIPLTTAALQRSEKEVEEALFSLANIYAQKLQDPASATKTYLELLQRFPRSEHAAETYYSLYLLYGKAGDTQQQAYYNRIKQEFPNTTYAHLVDDADFMTKNAAENLKAHTLYDSAYTHYEAQEYAQATKLLDQVVSRFPLNDIQDKVAFLEAMITARTKPPQALRAQLQRFKATYPNSPLQPQADALLSTYAELEQSKQLRTEAPKLKPKPAANKTAAPLSAEQKVNTAMALASTAPATPAPVPTPPTVQPQAVVPDSTAAAPARANAQPAQPVQEPQQAIATPPATPAADSAAATAPAETKDLLAYEAAPDSAYYFVLVYPAAEPAFKDVATKYAKYNSTYFRNQNLQADSVALPDGKMMLVMRSFADPKVALSYNIKQKAPQAPVGRIRGVEFATFVITSANYQKFLQKHDLEAYLTFFKNNY